MSKPAQLRSTRLQKYDPICRQSTPPSNSARASLHTKVIESDAVQLDIVIVRDRRIDPIAVRHWTVNIIVVSSVFGAIIVYSPVFLWLFARYTGLPIRSYREIPRFVQDNKYNIDLENRALFLTVKNQRPACMYEHYRDAGGWASLRALRALCGKIRNMTEPEEGVGCRRGIYGAARREWRMAGGQLRTGWEERGFQAMLCILVSCFIAVEYLTMLSNVDTAMVQGGSGCTWRHSHLAPRKGFQGRVRMIAVPTNILDPNGGFSSRTIMIGDFYDKKSLALQKCRVDVVAVSDSDHEGKDRGDIHPAWQDDDVDYVDWTKENHSRTKVPRLASTASRSSFDSSGPVAKDSVIGTRKEPCT
ncbi:hypothetical protein B0H13DRAFT_1856131 [Mycena leptocephala]|nr:hypothetical protein B0H13DRAFT_1856131 [Mycena leptocephala]